VKMSDNSASQEGMVTAMDTSSDTTTQTDNYTDMTTPDTQLKQETPASAGLAMTEEEEIEFTEKVRKIKKEIAKSEQKEEYVTDDEERTTPPTFHDLDSPSEGEIEDSSEDEVEQRVRKISRGGLSTTFPPENRKIVLKDKGIQVEECKQGVLYASKRKRLECTRNMSCDIQLHKAQGILCSSHSHKLAEYRDNITFSLMIKTTKRTDAYRRECILCPGQVREIMEAFEHAKGHGGELGNTLTYHHTVVKALEAMPRGTDHTETVCNRCPTNFDNPNDLTVHRALQHADEYQCPLTCDQCQLPLLSEDYDSHFRLKHTVYCCSRRLDSFGKQLNHYMRLHPHKLEKLLSNNTRRYLYRVTRYNHYDFEHPWRDEVRVISSYSRLDGKDIQTYTDDFRKLYEPGTTQTAAEDIQIPLSDAWQPLKDPRIRTDKVLREAAIKELIYIHLAQGLAKHAHHKQILTGKFPTNLFVNIRATDWCSRCKDEAVHTDRDPRCLDRDLLEPNTKQHLEKGIDEGLLDLYPGILIGTKHHCYGTGPAGQHHLLNLSTKAWRPKYHTGYWFSMPVQFRTVGTHQRIWPDSDYFAFITSALRRLPQGYSKPIFIEFFINDEEGWSEELQEAAIIAYYENLLELSAKYPHLFIVLGPLPKVEPLMNEEQILTEFEKAATTNRIIATVSALYKIPTLLMEGLITPRLHKAGGVTYWSTSVSDADEPIFNRSRRPTREFLKRFGTAIDIAMTAYQTALRKVLGTSLRDREPTPDTDNDSDTDSDDIVVESLDTVLQRMEEQGEDTTFESDSHMEDSSEKTKDEPKLDRSDFTQSKFCSSHSSIWRSYFGVSRSLCCRDAPSRCSNPAFPSILNISLIKHWGVNFPTLF